jgi:hypothetical protein
MWARSGVAVMVVLAVVGMLWVGAASAGAASRAHALQSAGPTPHGTLTLTGTLRDGSTITASGVTWTPVAGSYQSISYSWAACTASGCGSLSTPAHQPYLDDVVLGPGDVGKRISVRETATDVDPSGNQSGGAVTYETPGTVAAWPAGTPPRVSFIYGVPQATTASTRERFDISAPHANPADGAVTIACAIDGGVYSTACAASRSYLTPVLALGTHTVHVRASNQAGSTTTSYTWKVVAMPAPTSCTSCFKPPHLGSNGNPLSWDWQLQGALVYRKVDMFDIDGFDNSAATVTKIHARAGLTLPHEKAICYLSLGSWENFRPDERHWPAATLGFALDGYTNEHWVDVRQLSALMPVIVTRMKMCASKGFDGVEVDNIDGWDNPSGFPLTPQDAEAWLAAVANEAHSLNMFVLWKNDPYLASLGVRYFDGALAEQCFEYQECTSAQNDGTTFFPGLTCDTTTLQCGVQQFATAGKWVGEVEYKFGVAGEDGVVCDPTQTCTLKQSGGSYTEVPYSTFCSDVYNGLRFSAWRASESDLLNGTESYYCWVP